jgi:type IV pilus assembly protein PilC
MAAKKTKTATYLWEGTDKRGAKNKGEMDAENIVAAKTKLRKQGIKPTSVKKKPKPLFSARVKPITPADIAIFSRQLATMMKAGVPLIQSFYIVAEGVENPAMRDLIIEIKNEIAGGTSFELALMKHPRYFDELFCSLVGAGEQSGALETMLDRVATYKEKSEALKSKIKKAMNYPIAVMTIATVVTGILMVFVVPAFATTFASMGSDLPAFTQFVVEISDFVSAYWWVMIGTVYGIVKGFSEAKFRSKPFSDAVDRLTLKLPAAGHIIYMSVIARFARTLATTFSAGVPLVEALDSVAGATGNIVYETAVKQIRDDVTSGIALNMAIRSTQLFPSMLMQMVAIGEESGALDDMLDKVANHYEVEVDNAVDGLTALMEPIIMSFLGVVVGGLMVAMYLPIFGMGAAMAG